MSGEKDCQGYALGASCECPSSTACPLTPTPVPSEVAETTAGEREVEALLAAHEIDLSALRRDRETEVGYWMACACGFEWSPRHGENASQHRAHVATHLAALLDRVRREEGERIAQAIEAEADHGSRVGFGYIGCFTAMTNAAKIARAASVGRGEGL